MERCGCHGDAQPTWEYIGGDVDMEKEWSPEKTLLFHGCPILSLHFKLSQGQCIGEELTLLCPLAKS